MVWNKKKLDCTWGGGRGSHPTRAARLVVSVVVAVAVVASGASPAAAASA